MEKLIQNVYCNDKFSYLTKILFSKQLSTFAGTIIVVLESFASTRGAFSRLERICAMNICSIFFQRIMSIQTILSK
jgi:hypothetical protein